MEWLSCRKRFKLVYEKYYGYMYSVCLRYARNSDMARDFLHDGFIRVYEKRHLIDKHKNPKAYIARIMINNIIDHYRKRKIHFISYGNIMDLCVSNPGAIESMESIPDDNTQRVMAETLFKMLHNLSDKQRAIFNLYVIDDYKHTEIAKALGINCSTVRGEYKRAKIKLYKIFNEHIKKNALIYEQ